MSIRVRMSIGLRMSIKVLIVDDSPVVRNILARELAKDPAISVVGSAPDPLEASDKIDSLHPDVITLDIGMPRMDGLTFLRGLMKHMPLPVIIVSALTPKGSKLALEALELGALDIIQKPGGVTSMPEMVGDLIAKIKAAAGAKVRMHLAAPAVARPKAMTAASTAPVKALVAIGASTGGTQAIQTVLTGLPESIPPILIVQHMPEGFTRAFAERLNGLCPFEVKEAAQGDAVAPNRVLIAPGNFHMQLARHGTRWLVDITDGPKVQRQRPAAEVLFMSVARLAAPMSIGVILTGMGADGAEGMLEMKKAGARTIAQDEPSCVVFGMPKEAIALGGVDQVLPLDRIASAVMQMVG
jgi:two-component system chemotaxis response regulator CheB